MKTIMLIFALALAGCATTEFQSYESKNPVVQGNGGSKLLVNGMEIWSNGEPPRKFKIIGVIDDSRQAAIIPMAQLKGDIVRKAKEAGGDAVITVSSQSQIDGYLSNNFANVNASGNTANVYSTGYTGAMRTHVSKYVVIKYLD